MKIWKKALSVGLSLALCAGLVAPALAVTYDIGNGNVYVESDDDGVYSYQGTKSDERISRDKDITVTGSTTENTITVGAGVAATITLSGVNIDVRSPEGDYSTGDAAFSIGANSDVTVELDGENTIKSGNGRGGLELNDRDIDGNRVADAKGGSVTIQDTNKDGSLEATGHARGAGIGGTIDAAGNITIRGGTVNAIGGSFCVGIGGENVGAITIEGGSMVTARGGIDCAGIGSSVSGKVGEINISNSTVEASGNYDGAGIGSGKRGTAGDIVISGSVVKAFACNNAAGIGSGVGGTVSSITITDGSTVIARGGYGGAGIGCSANGTVGGFDEKGDLVGGSITIDGASEVKAIGCIGIGGGDCETVGSITTGDDVTLLALGSFAGLPGIAISTGSDDGEVAGNILIGSLGSGALSSGTVFSVLDKDGNAVREFDVSWEGISYYSFAIDLPESGKDYLIVQRDKDGNILRYLVYGEDNEAVYRTESSTEPTRQDGLVLKKVETKYEFASGTEGKDLPDQVTDNHNANTHAASYGDVDVLTDGGKWVFRPDNNWVKTVEGGIVDGKLHDETFTGYWDFDGYNYTVEFNPNNGEQSTTASGKVDETTPDMPDDPTKGGYKFVGWVDKDGNVITSFEDYIPSEDGEKVTVTALWVGKDYNVIVDPNGGSLPDGSEPTIPGKVGEEKKPEIPEPTRPGYDFNGWVVVDKDGNETEFNPDDFDPDGEDVHLKATWEKLPSKTGGPNRFDYGETQIDDVAVPLAGLFTRADAIGYLWEKSGSPEWALSDFPDVPEDHRWALAIGWAEDMGIALPDLEGNFRPDDLVLRSVEDIKLSPEGELEQFLNRYAVYAGIELEPGKLFFALDGEWDEIIMGEDAQIIFNAFFAKLEAALAELAA